MSTLVASPTKPWWRRWFGNRSERAAAKYLKRLGHRILVRNYCSPLGEMDLITLDGNCIVFIEVRSTEKDTTERPIASVNPEKQRRVTQMALTFMKDHKLLGRQARFDVLAVSWPAGRREPVIEHYPNAFEAVGRFQLYT